MVCFGWSVLQGLWAFGCGWSAQMINLDVAMMVLLAFVTVTALSQVILATLRIFTPNFLNTMLIPKAVCSYGTIAPTSVR